MLGIMIGTFQTAFEYQQRKFQAFRSVSSRAGMIAAFVLLDMDEDQLISIRDFSQFLKFTRDDLHDDQIEEILSKLKLTNSSKQMKAGNQVSAETEPPDDGQGQPRRNRLLTLVVTKTVLSHDANNIAGRQIKGLQDRKKSKPNTPTPRKVPNSVQNSNDAFLNLNDYVQGIELAFAKNCKSSLLFLHQNSTKIYLRICLFENPYYLHCQRALTIILIGVISLYGIIEIEDQRYADSFCIGFVLFCIMELLLKLALYLPTAY